MIVPLTANPYTIDAAVRLYAMTLLVGAWRGPIFSPLDAAEAGRRRRGVAGCA